MKPNNSGAVSAEIDKICESGADIKKVSDVYPFASDFDISDISRQDWERLFKAYPALAEDEAGIWIDGFIEAKILREGKIDAKCIPYISVESWSAILKARPELFSIVGDSEKYGWVAGLAAGLGRVEDCKTLEKFDVDDWLYVFAGRPELVKANKNLQYPPYWAAVLALRPEYEKRCSVIKKFKNGDWVAIFARQPQFARKYNKLKDFSAAEWALLLAQSQALAGKCRKWKYFTCMDWWHIIVNRPALLDKAKKYKEGWVAVISRHPEMISQCDKLAEFSRSDWEYLYGFKKGLPAEYLIKYVPDLGAISDFEWKEILKNYPRLIETAKKSLNGWLGLLRLNPKLYENEFPWHKMDPAEAMLLCLDLRLYDRVRWEAITLRGWADIMLRYAKDAEVLAHCPWDKFNRHQWLALHPKFADRCPFPDVRKELIKKSNEAYIPPMLPFF